MERRGGGRESARGADLDEFCKADMSHPHERRNTEKAEKMGRTELGFVHLVYLLELCDKSNHEKLLTCDCLATPAVVFEFVHV